MKIYIGLMDNKLFNFLDLTQEEYQIDRHHYLFYGYRFHHLSPKPLGQPSGELLIWDKKYIDIYYKAKMRYWFIIIGLTHYCGYQDVAGRGKKRANVQGFLLLYWSRTIN